MALNHSLDIEKGMIESRYFEIFETESYEIKHILSDLEKETLEHISRIEREIAETQSLA